jgi:solute carrier family 45 protein 1/2/4
MDSGTPPKLPKLKGVSFLRSPSPRARRFSGVIDEPLNEQSPLLRPRVSGEVDDLDKVVSPLGSDDWEPEADVETKSSWYLFLLTLGGLGLQIGWSVETSNGSVSVLPYSVETFC